MARAQETLPASVDADELTNAVSDERARLGVRRYLTIQGRDPFDEIDWETRTAFIPGKDKPVFEQKAILVNQLAAFNSPVWFNVGFEEKPQCSACQPYHALVSTPDGLVPIGELVDGDQIGREVYDAHGVTRIVAVKHNGKKPVFRVTLRNGQWIEASADHVVKAVHERRTEPQWLRVDQLEPGMRMHLHPHRAKVAQRALVAA